MKKKQFGFQKKKSCMDALIEFTEFNREGFDKKLVGQSCLVDLKKAFDTINLDLLSAKLEKYGFRGRILCLLKITLQTGFNLFKLITKYLLVALCHVAYRKGQF